MSTNKPSIGPVALKKACAILREKCLFQLFFCKNCTQCVKWTVTYSYSLQLLCADDDELPFFPLLFFSSKKLFQDYTFFFSFLEFGKLQTLPMLLSRCNIVFLEVALKIFNRKFKISPLFKTVVNVQSINPLYSN